MITKIRKAASPRKVLIVIILFSIFGFLYLCEWLQNSTEKLRVRQIFPAYECHRNNLINYAFHNHFEGKKVSQTRQRALIFLRAGRNQLGRDIIQFFDFARFKYHSHVGDIRSLPVLIDSDKGRYAVIVFEDMQMYLSLNQWNREMIDKYCRDFHTGMVYFTHPVRSSGAEPTLVNIGNFPLKYASGYRLKNFELNPAASLLRIARPGEVWKKCLDGEWNVFKFDHPTYQPVGSAVEVGESDPLECRTKLKKKNKRSRKSRNIFGFTDFLGMGSNPSEDTSRKLVTVLHDTGQLDGIQRVFFGSTLKFWLHKVLLLDALSCLSRGRLAMPLERYVQIDIDDVFVGVAGNRMNADDVMALLKFQDELRKIIPGFTFQLGFSGKFIYSGTKREIEGDRLLIKLHDRFSWFPHMWSHMQAHWFHNVTELCYYMDTNYKFALRWHLNTSTQYAVAPHHAGVFPVHEQLYECWGRIWNITTTSTEEYPHLRPDHKRKGFTYKGVRVLPRQTCGLFTHTMMLHLYPSGGPAVLHSLIEGGSLFSSFLFNRFNVFMTHFSNWGNDRLGIYTFDRAFKFVRCWTNLNLTFAPPSTMADMYFKQYPDEVDPIWLNPCNDKRHFEVWSEEKNCNQLPNFVVVGPQKTGTTALYWFLNMHPDVQSNRQSETSFEELQFFSGKNYFKGLDWYMGYFPQADNKSILFEKSATYFDQSVAPRRLSALLPKAPIVVILAEPGRRAYSWYQHMRSHDDKTALQYSFDEVIHARRKESPAELISLQRRCLDPGFYAEHLEKWSEYIRPSLIVTVDGEELKRHPAKVMNVLQKSLNFHNLFDYNKVLKFDRKKGFYCQLLDSGKTKCLGVSKGRKYPPMSKQSTEFLRKFYASSNAKLLRFLKNHDKPVPSWLEEL